MTPERLHHIRAQHAKGPDEETAAECHAHRGELLAERDALQAIIEAQREVIAAESKCGHGYEPSAEEYRELQRAHRVLNALEATDA